MNSTMPTPETRSNPTQSPQPDLVLRHANSRGFADHGWLKSWHTFSFADYYDPNHMGFRSLRVINDDIVAGGGGFPTHPHRDMEIITYVLSGALQHRDSMGNGSVIRPGNVQYMAAGSGIRHSEFNASSNEPVHLLQIWIRPDEQGLAPRYEEKSLATAAPGQFHLVTSGTGRDGSIRIHQDADLWIGRFAAGDQTTHALKSGRHAWVHVAEGTVVLNGQALAAGDAAAISQESLLRIQAKAASQVLLFDLH